MFFCFRWWRGPETTRSYIKRANKTSGGNLGGQKWLFHRNFLVLLAHGCLLSVPIRVTKMSSAAFFFLSSSQLQTDDKAVSRLKSTLAHFLKRWKNVNVVSSFFKISFWKQSKTELPPLVKKLEITTRKILVIYESGIDFPMANSTFFKNLYYFFYFHRLPGNSFDLPKLQENQFTNWPFRSEFFFRDWELSWPHGTIRPWGFVGQYSTFNGFKTILNKDPILHFTFANTIFSIPKLLKNGHINRGEFYQNYKIPI